MAKAKRVPNNGFVDSWGKLTAAGRAAVEAFRVAYRRPMGFLTAKHPYLSGRVRAQIRAGHYSADDFDADVFAAVSEAIRWYDPDKGAAVNTYLTWNIYNVARQTVRDYHRRVPAVSYEGFFDAEDGGGFGAGIPDTRTAPDAGKAIDTAAMVDRSLRCLSQRERYILVQRYSTGRTLSDLGEELGISKDRVRQLEVKARAAVRRRVRSISPIGVDYLTTA